MINLVVNSPIVEQYLKIETRPKEEQLQKVLEVPRQDLIKDLESVLTQILQHHGYGEGQTLAAIHCAFLLTELKSETSLPLLLELFKLDNDFLFCYFDDHPLETMWQDVLVMGKNNLDALFDFLKDSDMQATGTCPVADGLAQIALHFPGLRDRIIEGLRNIYKHLYDHRKDYQIEDFDWLRMAVRDLKAVELLDIIKLFFDSNRMSDYRKWNDFLEEMDDDDEKIKPQLSIFERYDNSATPDILFLREIDEIKAMTPKTLEELEVLKTRSDQLFKSRGISMPVVNRSKIGRNDPCPCGSGKKYKNCCYSL